MDLDKIKDTYGKINDVINGYIKYQDLMTWQNSAESIREYIGSLNNDQLKIMIRLDVLLEEGWDTLAATELALRDDKIVAWDLYYAGDDEYKKSYKLKITPKMEIEYVLITMDLNKDLKREG